MKKKTDLLKASVLALGSLGTSLMTGLTAFASETVTEGSASAQNVSGLESAGGVLLYTIKTIILKNWFLFILVLAIGIGYFVYKRKQDPLNNDDD